MVSDAIERKWQRVNDEIVCGIESLHNDWSRPDPIVPREIVKIVVEIDRDRACALGLIDERGGLQRHLLRLTALVRHGVMEAIKQWQREEGQQ